jgi:DNA polymerase III delta prime subunit
MTSYCTPSRPELFYKAQLIYRAMIVKMEGCANRLAAIIQNPGVEITEADLESFVAQSRNDFDDLEKLWAASHKEAWIIRNEIINAIRTVP